MNQSGMTSVALHDIMWHRNTHGNNHMISCEWVEMGGWREEEGRWSEYVYITYKLLTCHQMTTVAFHDITTMIQHHIHHVMTTITSHDIMWWQQQHHMIRHHTMKRSCRLPISSGRCLISWLWLTSRQLSVFSWPISFGIYSNNTEKEIPYSIS